MQAKLRDTEANLEKLMGNTVRTEEALKSAKTKKMMIIQQLKGLYYRIITDEDILL